MKKEFLFLVCLLLIGFTSAISSDLKTLYSPTETGIVEISGQILQPINPSQVEFKRINVNVPLEYDLKKVGNKYYLWFIAPQNSNNYTLIIKNIMTIENGVIKQVDYKKNFSVSGVSVDYYINPGFIITNNDFKIKIYSNLDFSKEITINYPGLGNLFIYPGLNDINFANNFNSIQDVKIPVGQYNVPMYITPKPSNPENPPQTNTTNGTINNGTNVNNTVQNGTVTNGTINNGTNVNNTIQNGTVTNGTINNGTNVNNTYWNESVKKGVVINPRKITSTMLYGERKNFAFSVINEGDFDIIAGYFDFDRNVFSIEPDEKFDIAKNQTRYFNITLNKLDDTSDEVYLIYDGYSYPLELELSFTENEDQVSTVYQTSNGSIVRGNRCSEIPGVICAASEVCSINTVQSLDGPCCTAICKKPAPKSNSWIGYAIAGFIIVGLLALWFWYSKRKMPVNYSPNRAATNIAPRFPRPSVSDSRF